MIGGYVSAGAGIARPPSGSPTSVAKGTDGFNTDQATTTFVLPNARVFDFGGGVTFLGALTVGASFEDSSSEQPGMVNLSLTHPLLPPGADDVENRRPVGTLRESDAHRDRIPLPAHGAVLDPCVRRAHARLAAPGNRVEVGLRRAWGYHAGVDGSYFFSKHVGVGGLLRYSRATVDLENPLQSSVDDRTAKDPFKAGGLRATGGIRVRF